ncbi:hypothetical protein PTTG_02884 [Puccinia triticina 1-1 BBBD Race 1]|uniref:Uncharacterized protein n=2 Tax=Puccinia triticina TaxID=208348 RepID=A0A180GNN5_PUCT1|nr:uncharacterized protein PtA15_1A939 [Puccinia triticina]OAV94078.1 hypothetical protein PTTG_02884 [Puccinia triticina 1-1 BBBD Race 1]WAQ81597.1 hypothetical protein PtA15_1A939 [Puccinia triticina]
MSIAVPPPPGSPTAPPPAAPGSTSPALPADFLPLATTSSALAIDPEFTHKFCSACRKNVELANFATNRKICNRHSSQPIGAASVASPESALYQMRSMKFCQGIPHRTEQKKVLDIYVDYDALLDWLDQRKDVDPRVDRVRRIPKENDDDLINDPNGQITLARRHATREARRVRDFIFIGTGLLFIHKTVAVGQKLQWTCQSRCSQSDRLKGGRDGSRRHSDSKRPSTSRTRYPCQGTTTVSLLHQQPGQRRLLHLVIKHGYVHGPHDDRNREPLLGDLLPETDFQVIDPALRNCSAANEPSKPLSSSSAGKDDRLLLKSSPSRDIFVDHQLLDQQLQDDEHQTMITELKQLLDDDESRNKLVKKLVLDQQLQLQLPPSSDLPIDSHQHLVHQKLPILRDFFHKRAQLMIDLDPLIQADPQKAHIDHQDHNIDVAMVLDPYSSQ